MDKEEQFLTRIFLVSLHKRNTTEFDRDMIAVEPSNRAEVVSLSTYAKNLQEQGVPVKLTINDLSSLLMVRLGLPSPDGRPPLKYLNDCFVRCSSGDAFERSLPESLQHKRGDIQVDIVNHAALFFQCPDVFNLPPTINRSQIIQLTFENFGGLNANFLNGFVQTLEQNSPGDTAAYFLPVVKHFSSQLSGRTLHDLRVGPSRCLYSLLLNKQIATTVAASNLFIPGGPSSLQFGKSHKITQGYQLLAQTVLGHYFIPTPLDDVFNVKHPEYATKNRLFEGMELKPQSAQHQALLLARNDICGVSNLAHDVTMSLIKAGGVVTRNKTLEWFGRILDSLEEGAKIANYNHQRAQMGLPPHVLPLEREAMAMTTLGVLPVGPGLNFFWELNRLLLPVHTSKVADLDFFYFHKSASDHVVKSILGSDFWSHSELLNSKEDQQIAIELSSASAASGNEIKFPAHVFQLACKALALAFKPAVYEYMETHRNLSDAFNKRNGARTTPDISKYIKSYLAFDSILYCNDFMHAAGHFINLYIAQVLFAVYGFDNNGSPRNAELINKYFPAGQHVQASALLLNEGIPSSTVGRSPQVGSLPARVLEDVMEVIQSSLVWVQRSDVLINFMDVEALIAFSILLIGSSHVTVNAQIRANAVSVLSLLLENKTFAVRVEHHPCKKLLIRALAVFMVEVQKSASYYHRVKYRVSITNLLEKLLLNKDCQNELRSIASVSDAAPSEGLFVSFLHNILNDCAYLLDEGLNYLAEIKKRESEGQSIESEELKLLARRRAQFERMQQRERDRRAGLAVPEQEEEEDEFDREHAEEEAAMSGQGPDRRNVEQIPFLRLRDMCCNTLELGLSMLSLLWRVVKECGGLILKQHMLLEQSIVTLNSCIDKLVGPRCLSLKVKNFKQFNFNPRKLLSLTAETLVFLERSANIDSSAGLNASTSHSNVTGSVPGLSVVAKEIRRDERYFKDSTYAKACRIIKREGLLQAETMSAFIKLTERVSTTSIEDQDDMDLAIAWCNEQNEEIPEEFLDPIMADLMMDPVILPTSGVVMDRKVIERHLFSESHDPFNRKPLSIQDLVPNAELKEKITTWVKDYSEKARSAKTAH